jgi:hypothetical protein
MGMVRQKRPSIAGRRCFLQYLAEATQKILVVFGIPKDRLALDSPDNDVMERTGRIYAGFAGHEEIDELG